MFRLFYPLIRFVLFRLDAEKTHDLTLRWLRRIEKSVFRGLITQSVVDDPIEVFGIQFPNRIGLAAGLDKNGECIDAFAALGFGHIEVGTVTPRPQPGNPKPRLFRLPSKNGIINRFGFNNHGVDQLVENVKSSNFSGVLGINIGKNFDTPVEKAVDDYMICMEKVYPYASYITVNISSPNTANLRQLQFGEALDELLEAIKNKQAQLSQTHGRLIPVLIKIAPDLADSEIEQIASSFVKHQVDGVIATNTTFSRDGVEGETHADEQGGLSGAPVLNASTSVLEKLALKIDGAFPIIGVGGIDSGDAAKKKMTAGASLVQVYSGFIYRGPALVSEVAKALKTSA
ncbi:quinone-dependent dihydroorotate dehydrogenase [Aliikangiella coralliicola]|uniref:Dihydroorotate dehydrogenase (quinone) n=1 Tax=Aliikangiella coralliicola TaxID=2592383 RepID=A0A545TWI5_9GAMM|nr:quinone-dependent dihydroorotate dehydrogenase [Aliikangiella coralliicola]TQV81572.1 quinone-dependent dihydroorotate dehydrogenase [Aliikangiella coralliicola]